MAEDAHPRTGTSHKRVGSVVRGKYRVEGFLAAGTMANVYAATHRNGAKVALKILHRQLAEDPSLCERFKREGYFANSIGHPGIVRAIDDDVTEDGCPFLVMELLEGETLDERRRRKGGKLSLGWLLPVADSLLEVLAAAHARDVVHRDLKPDNIFVTRQGEVKVLDFGVARWNDHKSSSDMTAVGMVLGTPAYMPPEQALGRREDVDAQSDIWAVGATLFVVLSGEPVHEGGDAKAKLIATARTAARPLHEAAPEVPRAVAAVIDRALAFHKQERWPDAEAMREALRWARMSLEDRPSQSGVTATSQPAFEAAPPPAPTRRVIEEHEEPTLTRPAVRSKPPSAAPAPEAAHDLSVTRPMATLTAPLAGAPDAAAQPHAASRPAPETVPMFPPPARTPTPPPPPPVDGFAPPPPVDGFAPTQRQLPTAPSLRVLAAQAQDSSRPSRPPEAPGPLLAELVAPGRGRMVRVLVPLGVGLVALIAVFLVLRTRAANARAEASMSTATAPSGSPSTVTSEPVAATTTATAAAPSGMTAPAVAATTPASAATEAKHPPRPRPKRKPAAPKLSADPGAAAPAAAGAEPTSPADGTDIEPPPVKEPATPTPTPTPTATPIPTATPTDAPTP